MFSIKHFLLGAGIAVLPVAFYGYIRLKPPEYTEGRVLAAHTEFVLRNPELYEAVAIASASPTLVPTNKPIPTKVPPKTIINVTAKTPAPSAPADIESLIIRYAGVYGVNKDMMIHIARCESGFRSNAVNGPYAGIYQFVSSTWNSNRRAMGLDPNPNLRFNAEESVKTAAYKMSRDGYGAWPVCQVKARRLLGLAS